MRALAAFLTWVLAFALPVWGQDAPRPAKVFTVTQESSEVVRRYPGIVLPSQEIGLSFRISGTLKELPIRASLQVKKGDVIAQLDTRDLETQLVQLQSAVDQAKAQLDALKAGARAQDIAALEAAVDAVQAQLDQVQEQVDRSRQLAQRGTVSSAQLTQDEAALRVAQAELRAKEEELSLAREGARPEEIAASEAALRGLEAQLEAVRNSISDATLKAPFDGVVARRDVENFANVQAGQSIALLQALRIIHVSFDLPAPDVTQLTANGAENITNTVTFDAFPGQEFPSETVEFTVQAEQGTQTYRGRVAVKLPGDALILPGMVGMVKTSAPGKARILKVPLTAVGATPSGAPQVWIVDNSGQVSERAVSLGEVIGAQVEVLDGLQGGDTVVAAGLSGLVPGMTIRPVEKIGG